MTYQQAIKKRLENLYDWGFVDALEGRAQEEHIEDHISDILEAILTATKGIVPAERTGPTSIYAGGRDWNFNLCRTAMLEAIEAKS